MFNDDVLAKCPRCDSSDTAFTKEEITCCACGFGEQLVLDDQTLEGMQKDVANALNQAKTRDVLQTWSFAG